MRTIQIPARIVALLPALARAILIRTKVIFQQERHKERFEADRLDRLRNPEKYRGEE